MKQKIHYLFMLLLMLVTGVGGVKAEETTIGYIFVSKNWNAKIIDTNPQQTANWTSGKEGAQLTSGQGIQITTSASGANGTSPIAYANISRIVVKYCTNKSSGVGKIIVKIGDGRENSFSVTKPQNSDGQTLKEAVFDYENPESGNVKVTGICTTNSVYIHSVYITYNDGPSLTPAGLAFDENSYTATLGETFTAPTLTNPHSLPVSYASSEETVATVNAETGAVTLQGAGTTTITASSAETDTYAAGEASYTLTVKKAPVVYEGNYFVKVTSADKLTNGAYLIVYEKGNVAFNGGLETLDAASNTISVTIDGNGIEATNAAKAALFVWDGEVGTLQSISGYYIGKTANSNGLDSSTKTAYTNTISIDDDGYAVITASGNCTLRYNKASDQNRFRYFKSGQEPIALYKLTTLTPKVSPELSFGETTEFNINLGDEFTAPTLTTAEGFDGTVTYSSDNQKVATVNAAGEVEIKGVGTAVITAASAETEHFTSGTASYTIKVVKVYSTIADFKTLEDGTVGLLNLTGAQVVFVDADKKNIYVRDNSGAIALFNNKGFGTELKAGDVLKGIIEGKYTLYKNLPEITNIVNINALTSNTNETVVPKEIAATKKAIGESVCDLVKITKTQIAEDNSKYFVGTDVQLYDKFGAGYSVETAKNVDVIGVATIFDATYEISPRTAGDIVYYPAAPTFSLEAGEVEKGTSVTITAEEGATLKYTVGEVAMTSESNTATVAINEDVTITALAVKDGLESEEVSAAYTVKAEEPVVEPGTPAAITAGFYTIKNLGNNQFVNVAGRKTATLVDNAEGMAGTVIQVESDADGIVKTLRSQGVDVPGYATRAMKYVPDVVKLVVEKLHVSGSGEILGETGVDKILDKFNKSVDVNLHVVHADGGYRIYGKTPSMTPVKEFYQENKANVDAKLPGLEKAINDAIATIVDKVGKGESLKNTFKLETIWKRMGWTDYEPGTEETTQVAFLQQVLANEENIWNFAYQTAMFYMEWVEGKQAFQEMQEEAPELMKYWNLAKKVRPNFMYYIVQKDGKVDVISQGNEAILNNDKSTVWALEEVSEFKVNLATFVEKTVYPTSKDGETTSYKEHYGTLYTDFAYRLPEGVTAYKVTGINKVGDKAYVKKAELNSEVVPAQTPVLLIANTDELTLTIAEGGEAVADNQLYGNDYLINEYDINTPQLEGVFNLLAQLSQSTYDKYEYLMRKNAGTVNNKYFFGIAVEGELADAYKAKTGNEMKASPIRKLGLNTDKKVGFIKSWDYLAGNEGFMFSEEVSEILMNIVGDVNRDGTITISDVTALVNIILGKATYPADADKYDFEAADVNGDKVITISDVTALVNIILGKTQN